MTLAKRRAQLLAPRSRSWMSWWNIATTPPSFFLWIHFTLMLARLKMRVFRVSFGKQVHSRFVSPALACTCLSWRSDGPARSRSCIGPCVRGFWSSRDSRASVLSSDGFLTVYPACFNRLFCFEIQTLKANYHKRNLFNGGANPAKGGCFAFHSLP